MGSPAPPGAQAVSSPIHSPPLACTSRPSSASQPLKSHLSASLKSESVPHATLTPSDFKNRKGLGLMHLNIRSITQQEKLDQLKILMTHTDPDILVLSETWLRHTVSDSEVALDGYNLFRIDRNTRGGGVAIYSRACLGCTVLKAVSVDKSFEFLAVKVAIAQNNSITVVGIYRPPAAPSSAINEIADLLTPFTDSELIVVGDFNLNWLSSVSQFLKEVCGNFNLSQIITAPTRPNLKDPSKSSLLDLI